MQLNLVETKFSLVANGKVSHIMSLYYKVKWRFEKEYTMQT